jgi:hypothetical protein
MTDKEEITDRVGMLSEGALDRLRKYFNEYDASELPASKQPAQESEKPQPRDTQKTRKITPRITPTFR